MNDSISIINNATSSFSFQDIMLIINVLKWPIVILVIVLLIKKSIVDLINRITKIGHGGTLVEAEQQKSAEKQEQKKLSELDRALGIFREETIHSFKDAVINETNFQSLSTEKEKIEHLLNYSIILYIIIHFERVYNFIFGTQILLLQHLNTIPVETVESLRRYYEYGVEGNKKFYENYTYEEYIGFLFANNLIVKTDDNINITILGVDFLKYLIETNKTTNKTG